MQLNKPWVRLLLFGVVVSLVAIACDDTSRTAFEPYDDDYQQEPDTLDQDPDSTVDSTSTRVTLGCNGWTTIHGGWTTLVSNNPDSSSALLADSIQIPSVTEGIWEVELEVELRYDGDSTEELFEAVAFMFSRSDQLWGTWLWEEVPAQWHPDNCPTVGDMQGLSGTTTVLLKGEIGPEDSGRWYQLVAEHGWSSRASFPCINPPSGASDQFRNSIEIGLSRMRFCEKEETPPGDSLECDEWTTVYDGWATLVSNDPDSTVAFLADSVQVPSVSEGCWEVELEVTLRYDGDDIEELFETVAFMFERKDYLWGTWLWEEIPTEWNPEDCETVEDREGLTGTATVVLKGEIGPADSGRWYQLAAIHGWSSRESFPCIDPPSGANAEYRNSIEIGTSRMRFCQKQ